MEQKFKQKVVHILDRERGKSFEEELDDLKIAIRNMQKARSRKGQQHEKKKQIATILPPTPTSSTTLSISTTLPNVDMKWLKQFREKNTSSPCPKENLERIKNEASPSISKKRERKDKMQKRLTELFAITLSSSKSTSIDPCIVHHDSSDLCDTISGDNMIHEIPTLSAEDTLTTTERNLMRSGSLSEDILEQLSTDGSIEEKLIKPALIPQTEFTRNIITENNESNMHPLEGPRKVLKSTHSSNKASKNPATYQLKSHFGNISVSGILYSFRVF